MKLYDVPRDSTIKVGDNVLDFKHIDGMYSLCHLDGKIVHLHSCTEVEVLEKEIDNE